MGLARIKRNPEPFIAAWIHVQLGGDGWLWAFHEGFFAYRRALSSIRGLLSLQLCRRVFDHGLGRSIWFTSGGER